MTVSSRRTFLRTAAAGGVALGAGNLELMARIQPVSDQQARLDSKSVRFGDDIEPTVRMLEETPRDRLIEQVAADVQSGQLSYREVLAALLLAGVRNVQPRPSVGFKFHAVLVVNSAHLASLASPESERWLPIFWALDYFKSAQARDVREGNWTMPAVDESRLPHGREAAKAFVEAMQRWDEQAADVAVAGLVRSASKNELFELFARYGARDFRSIGHKAIYVANAFRTLGCIGWQYAEPVLRSLTYALLNHRGEPNPATSDLAPDRPWRSNLQRVEKIRTDWRIGQPSDQATLELLDTLRTGSPDDASQQVVDMLNAGVSPQSVIDGLFAQSAELLMRQPGIVSLHTMTTSNAMRYAYETAADDQTRRLLLLQNAAFLTMFRESMRNRGRLGDSRIDQLKPANVEVSGPELRSEIFRDINTNRGQAASKVLAYLNHSGDGKALIDQARQLVFFKGNDSHDYKYSSAVLEDYYHVSPAWRDRFLAASVFHLRGSQERDVRLVQRVKTAFS